MIYYLHVFYKAYTYPVKSDIQSILNDLDLPFNEKYIYVRKDIKDYDVFEFIYVDEKNLESKVMGEVFSILERSDLSSYTKMDVMLDTGEYFVKSCEKYPPYLDLDETFRIFTAEKNTVFERPVNRHFRKSHRYEERKE